MKVTKKSWHYKLATSVNTDVSYQLKHDYPVSLCQYFWSVVVAGVGWFIMGWFALFLSWAFLTPLATFFVAFTGTDLGISFLAFSSKLGLGIFPLFWVLIPLIVGAVEWLNGNIKFAPDWMKLNIQRSPNKEKKPSLIVEWVKAKKAKVCPLVEVSDE